MMRICEITVIVTKVDTEHGTLTEYCIRDHEGSRFTYYNSPQSVPKDVEYLLKWHNSISDWEGRKNK